MRLDTSDMGLPQVVLDEIAALRITLAELLNPPKGRGKKAAFKRHMTRKMAYDLLASEPPLIPSAVEKT